MCGIIGAINGKSVTNSLIDGLGALSYRGYDSAGIAVIGQDGLERRRAEGKLANLEKVLSTSPLEGINGIGHTRWATHGAPTKTNAHPHMTSKVALVHNGIIENYQEIKEQLVNDGYQFQSDTDSETIPLLISSNLDNGLGYRDSIQQALAKLEGSFAIALIFKDQPEKLYAARRGSPLVVGAAKGGYYLASDTNALGVKSKEYCHLDDGDLACITSGALNIFDSEDHPVNRNMFPITSFDRSQGKQGFKHYMLKEIYEQPKVFQQTMANYIDDDGSKVNIPQIADTIKKLKYLSIIACGTSNYAGMIGKYWLEDFAGIRINLDLASEYLYRNATLDSNDVALFISQSGETADTLAALYHAKDAEQKCVSIINVPNSTIGHASDIILPTLAGTEIGVASTKAFIAQLAVFSVLNIAIARANNRITIKEEGMILKQLYQLPQLMQSFIKDDQQILDIALKLQHEKNMLYLGRGIAFPLALEGALKLKEISYIHAEAYPAGELKHGPIALVDDNMPVIFIAPPGPLFGKALSNLREVSSRGGKVTLISNQVGINSAQEFIVNSILMPEVEELLQPILYTLPLQLLAYHIARLKGTDIDQPRNLAKSVTVE